MRISDWSSDVCSSDLDDVEQTIPDSALMLRACGPIFSLQRRPPRHPAGARSTEIASLPLVRCPLQESKTMSKNKMLSQALFAALVGAATFVAQAAEEPGFYLGAGAGQSFVDEKTGRTQA